MRAVVQTVSEAEVVVEYSSPASSAEPCESVGKIGEGLLVLLGVTHTDGDEEARWIAEKIWSLRIMDGERSASDEDAPILLISQFTLYADTRKGRRPSWNAAAPGPVAEPLYEAVAAHLRSLGAHVETGRFGARMLVRSVNMGPNTILLER